MHRETQAAERTWDGLTWVYDRIRNEACYNQVTEFCGDCETYHDLRAVANSGNDNFSMPLTIFMKPNAQHVSFSYTRLFKHYVSYS